MKFLKNYDLEKNKNGYTLVLYLDLELLEFSDEFGDIRKKQINKIDQYIGDIIKNNFPNIKINSIRLVAGSMVVANIALQSVPGLTAEMGTNLDYHMSYAYFETGKDIIQILNATGDVLDVISPGYFDINPDGSLKITEQFNPSVIKEMQKSNYKIVPFLGNHWDRDVARAALKNKDKLIKEVTHVIMEYNLDGVNVDIENLTEVDRDEFTLFVKDLREALPKDKEVSIAVAANPKGYTSGWYGSFDNENLAKYADHLFIMSYDEHYDGGSEAGPIASIQFVEEAIQHLLKNVPSSKIVLGMPFFGRYWSQDDSLKGKGISLIRVNELVKKYNGTIHFDDYSKSPKAIINITGYEKDIPMGTYTIWFENEASILNKLNLIEKYDLKGAGSWSLHQATEDIWRVYNQWSDSSRIFIDVQDGWAKAAILAINEKGWMIGTRDFYFEPHRPLTRAQAATLLVRVLDLGRNGTASANFSDVPEGHWANADIGLVSQSGLMNGKGNHQFAPDEYLTREEMALLLSRLLKISPSKETTHSFKDVPSSRWSSPYIIAVAEKGIFKGYNDATFRPNDTVTRAEMATLLDRIKDIIPRQQ
ncbi:MAG: glycoside hydrolase [Tissierella sp.]|nr:glycoside hydrolase [Tissierella sp.]